MVRCKMKGQIDLINNTGVGIEIDGTFIQSVTGSCTAIGLEPFVTNLGATVDILGILTASN